MERSHNTHVEYAGLPGRTTLESPLECVWPQ